MPDKDVPDKDMPDKDMPDQGVPHDSTEQSRNRAVPESAAPPPTHTAAIGSTGRTEIVSSDRESYASVGLVGVQDIDLPAGQIGLVTSLNGVKTVETEQIGAHAGAYVTYSTGPFQKTRVDDVGRPDFSDSGTSFYAGVEAEALGKSADGATIQTGDLTAASLRLGVAMDVTSDTYLRAEVSHKLTDNATYGDGVTPEGRTGVDVGLTTQLAKHASLTVGYTDTVPDPRTDQRRDPVVGAKLKLTF